MTLLSSLMILLLFAVSKSVTANCQTARLDFNDFEGDNYVKFTSLTELRITAPMSELVNEIECRKVESVNLILKDAESDAKIRDEEVWTFDDGDVLNWTFDDLDICREYKVLIRLTGTEGEFDDSLL